MNTDKAFTLIEILVVVLIIGILAAITLPKYQKAVLKADLHRGINLVESLYQAQQAYYLANGDFAGDIDELDVSIPKNSSCTKANNNAYYDCNYGRIWGAPRAAQFQNKPSIPNVSRADIAYTRYLKDYNDFKAGKRYCFADPNNKTAKNVCIEMGGKEFREPSSTWAYYELD